MNEITLNWVVFVRAVLPFSAANIYLIVLVYFTIVRDRIGAAYSWYALFLISFILFLSGPLVNLMPVDEGKKWFDLTRNILLFSIGMPSLLCGLLIQAKVDKLHRFVLPCVLLGLSWSIFFALAPPFYMSHIGNIRAGYVLTSVTKTDVYYSQIALIAAQLLLPCLLLLAQTIKKHVQLLIYGVLILFCCMTYGLVFENWSVYYGGSAFTAIIWMLAVYNDVQLTNRKIKQHYLHQNSMALAQYTAPHPTNFIDYYPNQINEDYPFKEREALLDAVANGHIGIINDKVNKLTAALANFAQNNLDTFKVRTKELLFMMFDAAIFDCGHSQSLIKRLQQAGAEIDKATGWAEISQLLLDEATMLASARENEHESSADKQLVESIKTYILTHYDTDIGLNDVANNAGCSRSHATKVFKNVTAQTILQYLVDVRVHKAKSLLQSKSVTETAYEVGFNNSAYFSTVFKKQTGFTPKEYQAEVNSKTAT
ncbi:AraC family transcriptional regulator [Catenovulum agarivorans DS-2]|uniref:AraC family transcriptional regulator n=1 Tax=Catenovulum agarivorans DS-2 TaxID=1328313 RepID=W7QE94_9ALTE|nr:helix-turn-helix domain-containing protein [Catenovulum agarivorans]EWH10246.1 AraC family transcriptional regulator [Catenovulum agarivorans DS-2]